MTTQEAIQEAKELLHEKPQGRIYGPSDGRWMPAVLIRKRDLRLLIRAAEKGTDQ